MGHMICFDQTEVLFLPPFLWIGIIRESLEIQLNLSVLNQEEGAQLESNLVPYSGTPVRREHQQTEVTN